MTKTLKAYPTHEADLEILGSAPENALVEAVKAYLEKSHKALLKAHREDTSGVPVCLAYTAVIDDLLRLLYRRKKRALGFDGEAALVAVGGYGRGELNIRSDIDLVLLHRGAVSKALREFTEALLYVLYDTGLDLGFTMRTPSECLTLATGDLKTMTSLLETRFLIGDRDLYRGLLKKIKAKIFTKRRVSAFIDEKIEETEERYERYGGSVYILEPNIKEGEGGLRDLHTARWILMARDGVHDSPFSMRLVSDKDRAVLERGLAFLLWIRNELHFETSRKTDQLTFDHQEKIARLLGFKDTPAALGVESFMLEYYRHTSDIHRAYKLIASRYQYEKRKKSPLWPARKKKLDENYYISRGWLTLREGRELSPEIIVKGYCHMARHGLDLDQRTQDGFISYVHAHQEGILISSETASLFFEILRSSAPYAALSSMHSIGLLELLIPEFREIRHRPQHDLYHIYTVDTHSLFAVRELERLASTRSAEMPLASSIYSSLADRAPLVLATLLHDIGKGSGKGHARSGARLAARICKRLHARGETMELVEFLVENHLRLADTAQYRDMHDRKIIVDFAKMAGTRSRLDLLYLLTYADVRAVGPEVWSSWKGVLFDELYIKAGDVLDSGAYELQGGRGAIEGIKREVMGLVERDPEGFVGAEALLDLLPERYYLANTPETIMTHLRLLLAYDGLSSHALSIKQDRRGAYTSLIVCTLDRAGLFAMISGVMAANGIDILGAQITTLKNGLVLDVLQVTNTRGEPVREEFKHEKIEKDLANVLSGRKSVKKLIRRKPSILDGQHRTPVETRINIDNSISDSMSVIDIHAENKLGLLYDITSAISDLGLYINIARISTKGSEATDIFYVKDIFGQKVYGDERLERIINTLYERIEGQGAGRKIRGAGGGGGEAV